MFLLISSIKTAFRSVEKFHGSFSFVFLSMDLYAPSPPRLYSSD
ncbi:hypothetical protein A464_893 [Salmonella bongori N268-08]|uniref:Uncharacterized protein n=1 Tax=Salmonella bongori N268-08 TaxID=1197719 RepID=S5MTZ3_SALBN|nr:hypothetical protein A464_893 [Salmonella bongori N268-08]